MRSKIIGIFLLLGGATSLFAGVVYTQAWDQRCVAYQSQTDPSSGSLATVYDNFTLASSAVVTDLVWNGGFLHSPTGTITAFTIDFWADSSGQPGGLLKSATITGNANATVDPVHPGGGNAYDYSVSGLSFSATAGTQYWLSIVATGDAGDPWGWATGTGGDGRSYEDVTGSGRSLIASDMNFTLSSNGVATPEPGTLSLAGLALLAFGLVSRRRKIGSFRCKHA